MSTSRPNRLAAFGASQFAFALVMAFRVLFDLFEAGHQRHFERITKAPQRRRLGSLIGKLVIAVDLLEGSSDDFSMAAKSRKYLRKLGPALSVESFEPSLSISELAVLMQIRPLFVDLAMATGMSQDEAVQLLPLVD